MLFLIVAPLHHIFAAVVEVFVDDINTGNNAVMPFPSSKCATLLIVRGI